jgi:hypothetical protein
MEPHDWIALVVSPNRFEGKVQADILRNAGAKFAKPVDSLDMAMTYVRESQINIVLLSMSPSPEAAFTWVKDLRKLSGRTAQKAFVFGTAHKLTASLVEKCRLVGFNAVIGLPVTTGIWLKTIQKVTKQPRPFIECEAYTGPCRRSGIAVAGQVARRRGSDKDAAS